MSISEILASAGIQQVLTGGGVFVFLLLTLLQIAPIKVNPWSWIAKKIGRAFMKELYDKMSNLEETVQGIKDKTEEREASDCRSRILVFGDEIYHDVLHSKERFDQILLDITFYEHYCNTHAEYSNNVALMTIATIKSVYKKCMEENSFL